jgi:hypothetical protein
LIFIAKKINDVVEKETSDEGVIKESLMALQLKFELDEIDEEEYNRSEDKKEIKNINYKEQNMSKINNVRNAVIEFLKENNKTNDITVIKIIKTGDTWKAVAEVYEDDSFLKSMNLPSKKTRIFYSTIVDSEFEIISFSRLTSYDDSEEEDI